MTKILIIDDEVGMRDVIKRILIPHRYTIYESDTGVKALDLFQKENPDLVLLDTSLPDMECLELLIGLKRYNPKVPIIILCGIADVETAAELVKRGAFQYISKPFRVEAFLNLVNRALDISLSKKTSVIEKESQEESKDVIKLEDGVNNIDKKQIDVVSKIEKPKRISHKAPKIIISIVVAIVLLGIIFFNKKNTSLPNEIYSIPYNNPSAICLINKELLITDWFQDKVYRHQVNENLSLISSCEMQGIQAIGITFDGSYIWTSSSFNNKIYKHKNDSKYTVIAEYQAPGPNISGIYYDDKFIWSLDFQQAKIYKHNIDKSISIAAQYNSPASNPRAMTGDKKYFFIVDAKTNRIYKVRKDKFTTVGVYVLPDFENLDMHITGFFYDGRSFWVCADDIGKIFKYPKNALKRIS